MFSYKIYDNLVFYEKSLCAVFSIEPIDKGLLSEEDSAFFEENLNRAFNNLEQDEVQILMRTKKANKADYLEHFNELRKINENESDFRNNFLNEYIRELNYILENNMIPLKEYFIIFKRPATSKSEKEIHKKVQELDRLIQKFSFNLKRCGIDLVQITNEEKTLENLINSFIKVNA